MRTVLIVDDHAGFRGFARRLLEAGGFVVVGEANDGVGKAMSGGRIVISPPSDDAGEPCLVGNAALYGASRVG